MKNNTFATWYPIAFSFHIKTKKIYPIQVLSEPLILFRNTDGNVACLQDRCSHRSTPLSLGRLDNGVVECRYHGWQFNGRGQCLKIPALQSKIIVPASSCVPHKKVKDWQGIIWLKLTDDSNESLINQYEHHFLTNETTAFRFDYSIDLNIPHELMIENLLDPAHLPFAHHGTLSKREKAAPITFEVNETEYGLHGIATVEEETKTKKISFHFEAPFTVYFEVEFGKGKGMRQVHYCLPLTPTTMRLNTVFYYKNLAWLKWIPFMTRIQNHMSAKIVEQDIAMLQGQQHNLNQGANAWNQPINADKLALAYRRWLKKTLESESPWFKGF